MTEYYFLCKLNPLLEKTAFLIDSSLTYGKLRFFGAHKLNILNLVLLKKVMKCKRKWEYETRWERNITFDGLSYLNLELHNLNDASVHEASPLPTERV